MIPTRQTSRKPCDTNLAFFTMSNKSVTDHRRSEPISSAVAVKMALSRIVKPEELIRFHNWKGHRNRAAVCGGSVRQGCPSCRWHKIGCHLDAIVACTRRPGKQNLIVRKRNAQKYRRCHSDVEDLNGIGRSRSLRISNNKRVRPSTVCAGCGYHGHCGAKIGVHNNRMMELVISRTFRKVP